MISNLTLCRKVSVSLSVNLWIKGVVFLSQMDLYFWFVVVCGRIQIYILSYAQTALGHYEVGGY